jgi:DNA repair exonuclease SbcCD ATPase subunit
MKVSFVELCGFRGFRDKVRFDFPSGFVVFNGRNGSGKSTILDAIDFAVTGTITKFSVRGARGGGLEDHIWWVGSGKPEAHYVSVGLEDDNGDPFIITHSRERGADRTPSEIADRLCVSSAPVPPETLMQTTLIRDELIASLSLDLPEQQRFTVVRTAIGGMLGPDYSARTKAILDATTSARNAQQHRLQQRQDELGRMLGELTEARSVAERSPNVSEALRMLEALGITLPDTLAQRIEIVRGAIVDKRESLQELNAARLRSVAIQDELQFFNSETGWAEIQAAEANVESAQRAVAVAQQNLETAIQLDAQVREGNEQAAHIASLLEHGAAVGLQEGHCPLCDAVRKPGEFETALSNIRARLAEFGERVRASSRAVEEARSVVSQARDNLTLARTRRDELENRRTHLETEAAGINEIYSHHNFDAAVEDPVQAETLLIQEQQTVVQLERALLVLESSGAMDRVRSLETRIASLRNTVEQEIANLSAGDKALEAARQIDTSARTVANEILAEHFDTVMPLLKELYRRLRPHSEWKEIEVEFGGRVRASLNFSVEGGRNPQFLFSSGQRRAAGLAFLLAVHLSRRWCRWQSLILDDPVQHIDDYRALNLVEVLSAIRRTGRQIIVAVEDDALADVLCRRLRASLGDFGRRFDLRTSKTGSAEISATEDVHPLPREVLQLARAS